MIFILHDSIVVEKEAFESRQVGEVVDLSDLVVGELDRVELVQRRAQVLDRRDFVTWNKITKLKSKLQKLEIFTWNIK